MDNKGLLGIGVVAVLGYLVWNSYNNNANAAPGSTPGSTGSDAPDTGPAGTALDLSSLEDTYPVANVQALQNLEYVLATEGLTTLQQQMMLAQACQETGLLTDSPNWTAVSTKNNYAGISPNGIIATYPDIPTFVAAWIAILSGGASPITADNIADYNNRLVANHYYTDSPTTYGNDLNTYFNLIANISNQ